MLIPWYDDCILRPEDSSWFSTKITVASDKLADRPYTDVNTFVHSLIPYGSHHCISSWTTTDESYSNVMPYIKKNSRCSSCKMMYVMSDAQSKKYNISKTPLMSIDKGRILASSVVRLHPWIQDVLARAFLYDHVVPISYAYICGDVGVVMEPSTWRSKKTFDMEKFLDALDKVRGFLLFPNIDMFSENGMISNLSHLCFSTKTTRYIGTIPTHEEASPYFWLYSDTFGMYINSWDEWYNENKKGNAMSTKMTPREWNQQMVLFSIFLNPNLNDKTKMTQGKRNKPECKTPMACIQWLLSRTK